MWLEFDRHGYISFLLGGGGTDDNFQIFKTLPVKSDGGVRLAFEF